MDEQPMGRSARATSTSSRSRLNRSRQWPATCAGCRELYNAALEERKATWDKCGVSITAASQSAQLSDIKEVRPEYRDVHSQVLRDVLARLDRAFQAFLRHVKNGEKPGYPRLQGEQRYHSFTSKQFGNGATLDNGFLILSTGSLPVDRIRKPLSR